ncbi:peptidyl-prolyl cis-trans isomerase-like 3 isoform X2 [Arvicanthis niloticus]|uniref:peptidyl-prolyl cis-trans isomerase-like 3 isoform X2 n=1 Tax=Arvicanthis niloticus TaxID=61156 RepID=UPI00402B9F5C
MSVTLHTDVGDIKIEVFCERTPKTCENFLALCASNYYNGCVFHRNIKGFMVQTGDPTDRVSLCSPGCPGARFVDEAGLKLSSERSVCHCFLSVGTKGTGRGGSSIWGKKFEDEYSEYLKVCVSECKYVPMSADASETWSPAELGLQLVVSYKVWVLESRRAGVTAGCKLHGVGAGVRQSWGYSWL